VAFRDVLALQGVFPASKGSTPGFRLGQITGVWIDGVPAATTPGAISWLQLSGVWITGASVEVAVDVGGGSGGIHRFRVPRPDLPEGMEPQQAVGILLGLIAVIAITEIYYE